MPTGILTQASLRRLRAPVLAAFALIPACGPTEIGQVVQGNAVQILATPLDGAPIIDRLRETYWSCQTYRDQGALTLTYGQPGQQRSLQWTFSTAFRQPRLRFAFGEGPGMPVAQPEVALGHCAWAMGDGVDSHLPDLDGMSMRQFISIDTLGTIPALLATDQVGPGLWTTYGDYQLVRYEDFDGLRCMVVEATARHPITGVTLWIDAEQYLLRRKQVEFTIGDDGSLGRQVTEYTPVLEGRVDEAEFKSGS